jgi:hypothetical protein
MIIEELKSQKCHFNELKRRLKVTPRVLSSYLRRMEDQGIIGRDPFQIGKPRNYWLTEKTILEMELGYFENIKSARNIKIKYRKLTESEQNKIIVHLILRRAAFGVERLGEPRPISQLAQLAERTSIVYSENEYYEPSYSRGFSLEDIIENTDFVDGLMFKYAVDKSSVEKIIRKFTGLQPPIIKLNFIQGELLYTLHDDELLKKFIIYCGVMLGYVIRRMERTWNYRKPKSGEVNWYKSIYGRNETTRFFLELQNKKDLIRRKKEKSDNRTQQKRSPKEWDKEIKDLFYFLNKGNEFDPIRNSKYNHYRVFSELLLQESYPHFLRILHKTNQI